MFRSEYSVGGPKKGVGSRGVDRNFDLRSFHDEVNFGTFAFADPVSLHFFEGIRPFEEIEILKKAFSISGNLKHPLAHRASFHRMVTSLGPRSL